jgi:hypothetical protein
VANVYERLPASIGKTEGRDSIAQAMKIIIDFNGSQLKEIKRFVDTLLQIRQQQGKKDDE